MPGGGDVQNHSERGGAEKDVHSGNTVPIVRLTWAVSCSRCPSSDMENLRESSQYPGRDSKPRQAGER